MKNALFLLVYLWTAGPTLFGQAAPAKGSIEGQVVDAKTNAPIKKAAITMQGWMPFFRPGQPLPENAHLTTETDAKGSFIFRDLDAANYQISVQRAGYVTMPYQGFPNAAVVLGRGQNLRSVTVKLIPQAVIAGKVLDEDGEAVQGAQVTVLRRDESRRMGGGWNTAGFAQTDDLGEYRIASIAPGNYLVRATWRNNMRAPYYPDRPLPSAPELAYIPTHHPSAPDANTATAVKVEMGAEVRGIDIRLRKAKTVSIRGHMEGLPSGGNGSGGFNRAIMPWVALFPRGTGRFDSSGNMMSAMQSGDGNFEIGGVLPGSYLLISQWNDPNAIQAMAAVKPIEVSDKPIDGIVLRLEIARDVQGTVTVEEKTPLDLGNARVRLTWQAPTQGRFPEPARIAGREFTLKDVSPVPASVEVDGLPTNCYVKGIRYGGRPVPVEGVALTTGEQLEVILSTAMAELAGTVVDANGKTVPSAVVTLVSDDTSGWPQQSRARAGGDFAMSVKPGEYQAIASEEMDMNLLTPELLRHFAGKTTTIKLAPGSHEITKLTLVSLAETRQYAGIVLPQVQPLGSVAGTVVDSKSGAAVKNSTVSLVNRGGSFGGGFLRSYPAAGSPSTAETDERGRFSISNVEPGFYRITAQARGHVSPAPGFTNAEDLTVVGDGQQLTDVVVKIEPQAVITGKIVDEDGEPLAHARVSALRNMENGEARQWRVQGGSDTDDRGEYRVANLGPGSYLVRATYRSRGLGPVFDQALPERPDMTYRVQFYPDAAEAESAKLVNVATGAEVAGIDMKMQRVPTVRVRGKLTGEEPGIKAALRLVMKKEHGGFPVQERTAIRGPEGAFEFSGVRPGSYYLVARDSSNSRFAVQSIEVGEKHIAGLTVDLAGRREIRATVKLENARGPIYFSLVPTIAGLPQVSQNVMDGDTTLTLSNVAPIPYRIGDNLGPDYYWKSIVQGGQPITGRTIDFGTEGLLEITVSSGAARVDGSVVDPHGKPVPNAPVALAPAGGTSTAVRTGTADAQGRFYIGSVAPGDYRVAAWAAIPPGQIEDAEFVRSSAGNSTLLSVAARDRKTVQVTANAGPAR
ncbi:MAG: carboxypeptidase regulatory-like domain-containing protein [Bryobacteraceae bacterium]